MNPRLGPKCLWSQSGRWWSAHRQDLAASSGRTWLVDIFHSLNLNVVNAFNFTPRPHCMAQQEQLFMYFIVSLYNMEKREKKLIEINLPRNNLVFQISSTLPRKYLRRHADVRVAPNGTAGRSSCMAEKNWIIRSSCCARSRRRICRSTSHWSWKRSSRRRIISISRLWACLRRNSVFLRCSLHTNQLSSSRRWSRWRIKANDWFTAALYSSSSDPSSSSFSEAWSSRGPSEITPTPDFPSIYCWRSFALWIFLLVSISLVDSVRLHNWPLH